MLLLQRVLAVAGGCCFLRGHEGKEERGSARGTSLLLLAWRTACDFFESGTESHCGCNDWKFCRPVMDGCGSASACGSLGDYWHRERCVLAAGPWPYPFGHETELEAVAVCPFSSPIVGECGRCARFLCGGPNPPTRALAALRFVCVCLCVRAGVGGGAPRCSFRILLCPALRMGALLCSPRTCLMYCRFFLFPHVEHRHTLGRKANKRETLL
ncbi:hypothetical protein BCY84_05469 [Trypanosoma cruzi cruzi]|nr:hypothetical protein BCY84_05469 [Trypanosoma cruzi cruzi]